MGIDIFCCEQSYSCSYTNWSLFRNEVIYAAIAYIWQLPSEYIKDNIDSYENVLEDFLSHFSTNPPEHVDLSKKHFSLWVNPYVLDMLISLGLNGLCSFCYKNDCGGFYSVGNSYDICALFDKIKPFMTPEEDYLYVEKLEGIRKVFQESFQINSIVTIG